jgi:RNA polymerase sigma-70 factor (ECF subfamily)
MSEEAHFCDLILRVRRGDEPAAAELVERYEPALRRAVRVRLRDARLRRQLDSMDICQSVFASFFVRTALGQYELHTPEQLLRLLATMARNKVANAAHRHQAECRDYRRVEAADAAEHEVHAPDATPSRIIAGKELLQEARRRLPPEERQLLELREQGHEWKEIAGLVGGSPGGLRKRLDRAIDRVVAALGLDEGHHE